jgi:acetyl esterase/lipase
MRRPRVQWLWVALLAVTGASAPPADAAEDDFTQRRVVYTLPGMERVQVQSGRYRTRDNVELPVDVYLPSVAKGERRAAVILVHGGPIPPEAFPNQWGVYQSYGRLIAASGRVAIAFTHRLYEASDYPRAAADVTAAVDHVRERAATGVDPDRIGVWAFSGGGPLASFLFRERPPFVRCAALYYAILDFQGAPPIYGRVPRELSPVAAMKDASGTLPAVLVARAGLDEAWINEGIDRFVGAANSKGVSVDLLTLPKGHHGFDIADDDARSRQVIQTTLAFLKGRLAADSGS